MMPAARPTVLGLGLLVLSTLSVSVAQTRPEPARPSLEALERVILDKTPETRVEKVDHDRITARRIDIAGDDGVIRMTLAADTPPPIIDGIQYQRAFGVSGLILYDIDGNERGGFGVADAPGGTAASAPTCRPRQ